MMGREAKVPETPAQHAALAKYYDEKAAEAKLDAAYHRSMAAQFQKANVDPKDVAAMQKHCDKLAKDADDQAKEAGDGRLLPGPREGGLRASVP
jgi:hypothetical protein